MCFLKCQKKSWNFTFFSDILFKSHAIILHMDINCFWINLKKPKNTFELIQLESFLITCLFQKTLKQYLWLKHMTTMYVFKSQMLHYYCIDYLKIFGYKFNKKIYFINNIKLAKYQIYTYFKRISISIFWITTPNWWYIYLCFFFLFKNNMQLK